MRGLKISVLTLFCAGALAAGCGRADLSRPPKMNYGRDLCAECRMIVQEERFACAIVTADARALKFDDIGCMQVYQKKNEMPGSRAWVHDFESAGWIDLRNADLAQSPDRVTPMGSGITAHKRRTQP